MTCMKLALTSTDLLIHPVPWHLFIIDMDASENCLGAVLQQSKTAIDDLPKGEGASEQKSEQKDHFKFKERD